MYIKELYVSHFSQKSFSAVEAAEIMGSIKIKLCVRSIRDAVVVYDPAMQAAFEAKKFPNETPTFGIKNSVRKTIEAQKEPTDA